MAVLPIICWPDARLTTVCSEINGDVSALAADMLETMYAAPGRGLAAPQVGVLLRLFVMDCTWKDGTYAPRVLINPQLLWAYQKPELVQKAACLCRVFPAKFPAPLR